MLQPLLRCGLTSGSSLSGWAVTCWAGISGTMFRTSRGRVQCRLRLLWGEFSLLLGFWVFCFCRCCWLLLYVGWLGFMVLLWWVVTFFFRWSAWFGACRVTASLCYLLSSNRDDSVQKTAASLPFCRANCVRTVCTCMCLFCFLSKNENINGFGTIGLNFLFLTKSVWRIFALLLYSALFSLVVLVWIEWEICIMSTI